MNACELSTVERVRAEHGERERGRERNRGSAQIVRARLWFRARGARICLRFLRSANDLALSLGPGKDCAQASGQTLFEHCDRLK